MKTSKDVQFFCVFKISAIANVISFTDAINVCKQNVKTSGVEGTITGSFTADQLRSGDYECVLQFNDVLPYSVFELYVNSYSFPYPCFCDGKRCNDLQFEGFSTALEALAYHLPECFTDTKGPLEVFLLNLESQTLLL